MIEFLSHRILVGIAMSMLLIVLMGCEEPSRLARSDASSCSRNMACKQVCLVPITPQGYCKVYGPDAECEKRRQSCSPEGAPSIPPVVSSTASLLAATAPPPNSGGQGLSSVEGTDTGSTLFSSISPASSISPNSLVPVRQYVRASDIPPDGVGAYGILAFKSRPTDTTRPRLLKVCQAFKAYLPRRESIPTKVNVNEQMITIWPLDDPGADGARSDDCNFIIDHYDLYAGLAAITDAKRQGAQMDGEGPFLIGWSPSNTRGVLDKIVLVFNLSKFESQDSFNKMFELWQSKIIEDPDMWRSGFSVEEIRLVIRDFVDHYGKDFTDAFQKYKK